MGLGARVRVGVGVRIRARVRVRIRVRVTVTVRVGFWDEGEGARTSCHALRASRRLMYPGVPHSTSKGSGCGPCIESSPRISAGFCCGLHLLGVRVRVRVRVRLWL